ncbi:DUF397 domain-containing protein [Streptomyces sp. NPDC048416]|uniref:DUF397 domain-containing protein n=1 Tax=Streptomyces sp. NPDC048416 TaxID=3365546 RepID=UPI0037104D95
MSATPSNWQKATASGGGGENCIELQAGAEEGTIRVRESLTPGAEIITTKANLAAFLEGVKNGEFDHFVK